MVGIRDYMQSKDVITMMAHQQGWKGEGRIARLLVPRAASPLVLESKQATRDAQDELF